MRNKRNLLIGICTIVILLLAACGNAAEETSATSDKDTANNNSTQSTDAAANSTENDASSDSDDKDNDIADTDENKGNNDASSAADNTSSDDTGETANDSDKDGEEDISSENADSQKEKYLDKLNTASAKTEEARNNPADSSTYAMKNVEGNNYTLWDGLLNEVYQVLENQLTPDDMEQLRQEQHEWINYRDSSAQEASLKYKGGTQEQLEYTTVLVNLTEERCFELVENYMK